MCVQGKTKSYGKGSLGGRSSKFNSRISGGQKVNRRAGKS